MDEEIKELIKKNLEISEETLKLVKKIRTHIIWQQVLSVIKVLLIVVPLILGLIYLPQILNEVVSPYKELLNLGNTAAGADNFNLNDIDFSNIPPDLLKSILK